MAKATYRDAGVDLEQYADAMARLPRLLARTATPRVIPLAGGFAGLFQLDFFTSPLFARKYKEPVLVSCTDGVGTKLKVAIAAGRHRTVGIDLVAMSVNDALCLGAEPLFFLDYVAVAKDDPALLEQIVSGVTDGCLEAECALLGGETAILPDLYAPGDYDLAGFCVGVVERGRVIDGQAVAPGDVVLGLPSSGLHSNGYSLARKIVFEIAGLKIDDRVEELGGRTVGEELLEPTRIYVKPVRRLLGHYRVKHVVHAIAHITGGGLLENLARVIPASCTAVLRKDAWTVPAVFPWLQRLGEVDEAEMRRVFNMGVGLVLVVAPYFAESIREQLRTAGVTPFTLGRIEAGGGGAVFED
jgi:phosphoribosylformylglycinamidine cyclo-ligase